MIADGTETTFRQRALDEIKRVNWDPLGRRTHHQHDRHAPRLVHLAPAHLGRAYRRLPLRGVPQPLNDPSINKHIVDLFA